MSVSLRLRPLSLAFIIAGLSAQAQAQAIDLMQAYELARQSDPQLAAAEAQHAAQSESVVQSRAALLPQINAQASLSRDYSSSSGNNVFGGVATPTNSTYSHSTSRSSGVTVNQSLFNYSNYTKLDASKARTRQTEAQYDAADEALIVRVADAYFNALTAIETLASAQAAERAVKRQFDLAEKRLEVGLAPITDVHEARARYDSARADAIIAANLLDDAYEALAEITGQPQKNLMGLANNYQPKNTDKQTAEDWVKIAVDANPVLRANEEALAAAEKDVRTARAAHYPTLAATASYGDTASWGDVLTRSPTPSHTTEFANAGTGPSYGITLTVPIFAGFSIQSRVRQALFQRDVVADQLEQQKRAIVRQTRGAYRALISGEAEVEARRLAVVSAKAAYEAGDAGLEVGTRTIVDVLIAQQQVFLAQREYARARHAFLVNELRLRQAAGVLEVKDLESVNRFLVTEASTSLDETELKTKAD